MTRNSKTRLPFFILQTVLAILAITAITVQIKKPRDIREKAAVYHEPFYGYDTHPNFWPAGSFKWTAKQYIRDMSTPSSGYEYMWIWSGPNSQISGGRSVIYQKYSNGNDNTDGALDYHEWELWTGTSSTHTARVYKYGGVTEDKTTAVYAGKKICEQGYTGLNWPDLGTSVLQNYAGESRKSVGTGENWECTNEYSNTQKGGYISIEIANNGSELELWSTADSKKRIDKCNKYVPGSGNAICRTAPQAAMIYQKYTLHTSLKSYVHGCEAAVYAWGYPNRSSNNYQEWFRNGELRWSLWKGLGTYSYPKSPTDSAFWNQGCAQALTGITNFVYTGKYKLNDNYFKDSIAQ